MRTVNTTLSARTTKPKPDVIAIYIGFIGNALHLYEVNSKNKTLRQFTLDVNDADIPREALEEAQSLRGSAFNQVKVFQHADYIEYYHVTRCTYQKKQDFWVRRHPTTKAA